MNLSSPAFEHNHSIPAKYTCDGEDINPPLEFADIPAGAKSLVLIMDDPDAPAGTWAHWIVWNIDPSTAEIAENSAPLASIEGVTSFGKPGYGGPCPPSGTHRYFFKLYAVDTKLDIPGTSEQAGLEKAMQGHILEEAELVGLYGRSQ